MVLMCQRITILLLLNLIFFTNKISAPTKLPSSLSKLKEKMDISNPLKEKMDISNPLERYQSSSPNYVEEADNDETFALLQADNNSTTPKMNVFLTSVVPPKIKEEKPLFWFWITLGSALLLFFMLLFLGVFALIWRIIHGETVKDILWTK